MEVEVRRVASSELGFVALPLHVIYTLQNAAAHLPPMVALQLSAPPQHSWFVAWTGASSKSSCIEVPDVLASCIGLPDGAKVCIRACTHIPEAHSVQVEPATTDDCEVLELNAAYLENLVLTKVGVVQEGCKFPVSIPGQGTIILLAKSTSPAPVVKLVPGTELVVALKRRLAPVSNASVKTGNSIWLRVQGCTVSNQCKLGTESITVAPTTSVWISPVTADKVALQHGQLVFVRPQVFTSKKKGANGRAQQAKQDETQIGEEKEDKQLQKKHKNALVRLLIEDMVADGHVMVSEPLRSFLGVRLHSGVYLQPCHDAAIQTPRAIRLFPLISESSLEDKKDSFPGIQSVTEADACNKDDRRRVFELWLKAEAKLAGQDFVPSGSESMVSFTRHGGDKVNFLLSLSSNEEKKLEEENKPVVFSLTPGTIDEAIVKIARPQFFHFLPADEPQAEMPSLESLWLNETRRDALSRLQILLSPTRHRQLRLSKLPLPGGVLIQGPPSCGKTQLALALARQLNEDREILAHWVLLSCGELFGEADNVKKRALKDTFLEALEHAPCLIILDDLDLLLEAPEGDQNGPAATSLSEYLSDLISDVQNLTLVGFVATASVSSTSVVESSGKFDFVVELAPPRPSERAQIIKASSENRGFGCDYHVANKLADCCEGYDANDLEILVDRAVHASVPRLIRNKISTSSQRQLTMEDFENALQDFTPSALRGVSKAATEVKLGWNDIGGLQEVRRVLQELLELPVKYPKIFSSAPLRLRTGVLLYGPPGCGKTHAVAVAAAACSLRFVPVKGPELLDKYIGASEKAVRDIFVKASAAAPCILFFDEFDAIAPKRGHDNTGVTDRVVNQLLAELDGVSALSGVFVFAASNRPDLIDAALLRPGRLDHLLFCNFPSASDRLDILRVLSRNLPLAEDVDLEYLAYNSEGFSGADIKAVLSDAELEAVHVAIERRCEHRPRITMAALRAALARTLPLQQAERRRLNAIYDSFSSSRSSSKDLKGKKATLA